ncbi:MAG: hypothetical protein NZM43_02210 [Saprospiraceae bacterium]|nr:hypothetical protein [Saprospiraceae bacterium]MDW8483114.1 hypothetical protein [Saprospiraceae bacterium]
MHYLIQVIENSGTENLVEALNPRRVFNVIFGEVPFSKSHLNRVQHEALRRVREFILLEKTGMEAIQHEALDLSSLVEFFMSRGATKVAYRYIRQYKRQTEKNSLIGQEKERRKWAAARMLSWYRIATADVSDGAHLPAALAALDEYYLTQRADLLLALLSLSAQYQIKLDTPIEDYINTFFAHARAPWVHTTIGKLYCYAIRTFIGEPSAREAAFEDLLALYLACREHLEKYERERFETVIYNFCARNFQNLTYREHLLNLYQQKANQLSAQAEIIHANAFISLVRFGIYFHDLDFVRKLIARCRNKVYGPAPSEAYHRLALAHISFEEGAYEESLSILNELDFEEPLFQYLVRVLEIKNGFELGLCSLVESRLHALRMAITRDKRLPLDKRQTFRDFHRIVARLWHLKLALNEGRRLSIVSLQRDIQAHPAALEIRWLQEKLADIERVIIATVERSAGA